MISRRMARSATSEMVQGDGYDDGSRRWIKRISKAIEKREDLKNEDKAEHRKAYDLQYREQNPDKIKLKTRRYYNENKASCLLKSREWKAKNPEKTRAWKEKNKTKLKAYDAKRLEKIQCECGCMVAKMHLGTHQKTMKHSRLLKQVNDTITEDPA